MNTYFDTMLEVSPLSANDISEGTTSIAHILSIAGFTVKISTEQTFEMRCESTEYNITFEQEGFSGSAKFSMDDYIDGSSFYSGFVTLKKGHMIYMEKSFVTFTEMINFFLHEESGYLKQAKRNYLK